jgi:hydroxymethylbilane synthase
LKPLGGAAPEFHVKDFFELAPMTASRHSLRIGTRGSPLALAQAAETRARLLAAHPDLADDTIETVVIRTTGDRIQDRALSEAGGKGLFTLEIEQALLAGDIDLAVHSMKDMPTALPDGLVLAAFLPREDPRDVLLTRDGCGLAGLHDGAVVGTASLRRQAILRHRRPDLKVVTFRGNVGTRLDKLARGEVDATLLALAGLRRLGLADKAQTILEIDEMLPAVAQGAIGLECRAGDAATLARLAPLDHRPTHLCVAAERALLAALDGSCRTPIAGHAVIDAGGLHLQALIVRPDGSEVIFADRRGSAADGVALGTDAGAELKARGGAGFFG